MRQEQCRGKRALNDAGSNPRRGFPLTLPLTSHHTTPPVHQSPYSPYSPTAPQPPVLFPRSDWLCRVYPRAFPDRAKAPPCPPVHRGNRVSRLLPQTLSLTQTLSRQKQKIVAVGTTGAVSENSLCRQLLKLTFSDCGFLFYFILDCTNLILQHLFFSLSVYLSNFSLFLSLLLSSV